MIDITQLSRHLIPANLILCDNKPNKQKPEGQKMDDSEFYGEFRRRMMKITEEWWEHNCEEVTWKDKQNYC